MIKHLNNKRIEHIKYLQEIWTHLVDIDVHPNSVGW